VHHSTTKVGGYSRADVVGRPRPHVGLHESREEILQKLLVDQPPFSLEQVADIGEEQIVGLLEALPEAIEECHGGNF